MKTPITPIRLPLNIKAMAKIRAEKEKTNLSQIMIKALTLYLLDEIIVEIKDKIDKLEKS